MNKLPIIFLLILLPVATQAEFYSGSKLYSLLEKNMRGVADYEVGLGSGYITGVFDTLSGTLVCSPQDVTFKQVQQIVFNYMQKHPESWDKSADSSVFAALSEVWPCMKK